MAAPEGPLAGALRAWDAAGLRRTLTLSEGVDFCSNDYLGLARDPRLCDAAGAAARDWGAGSGAARLLGGHLPPHAALEATAASWLGVEATLLFPSGWQANVGLVSTLGEAGDVLLCDAGNHASLIDGSRLSHAQVEVFDHLDAGSLADALERHRGARRRYVVTESVYSMDGALAPLDAYAALAAQHDAWLIVDEAHAAGVHGPEGRGRAASLGDGSRLLARVITGGKALGAAGALVAGSRALIDLLINRSRAFVFTTAVAPAVVAALQTAIELMPELHERRQAAHRRATRLRDVLQATDARVSGDGPIVYITLGTEEAAVALAEEVRASGLHLRAVRPPTVPRGRSGVRIVCHADHSVEEVDRLAAALRAGLARVQVVAATKSTRARGLVVLGTDTDVGKTVVSALLVRALRTAQRPAAYWKPLQTGTVSDSETVEALTGEPVLAAPLVELPLPASLDQAAAAAGRELDGSAVLAGIRAGLAAAPDQTVILEMAGGLLVPLNDYQDQSDLVSQLGLPCVLVARSGLGTLNHTRLTMEALRRRHIRVRALVLVGEPHRANLETLRKWLPGTRIHEVPLFDSLSTASLDTWLAEHPLTEVVS